VSTTGVHKSEKKEVCGELTAEPGARVRDGSWSRRGALAEQGPGAIAPARELSRSQAGRQAWSGPSGDH
jgi:hypothetical protein